jgi:hypothetical protein
VEGLGVEMKGISMKFTVEAIRAHDDKDYKWKFVVQGSSIKHVYYGRVYSYVLDDRGAVRVFDTEADAWAFASVVNRTGIPLTHG